MQVALTPIEEFEIRIKSKADETKQRYRDALKDYASSQSLEINDIVHEPVYQMEERLKAHFRSISRAKYNILASALNHLFKANRVKIDWDHVSGHKPDKPKKVYEDKPYSKEQIQLLLRAAPNPRVKLAILTMSTAGLRVGALPGLYIKNLTWIEQYKLYALKVYPDTEAQYWTFITPQASEIMKQVIGKRGPERPIFYNLHEPDLAATKGAHESAIWRLLVKSKFRQPVKATERHEIQMDHGFRKYFRTSLDAAKLREDYAERLMDHGPYLVRKYSKMEPVVWLETSGYLDAIEGLTF